MLTLPRLPSKKVLGLGFLAITGITGAYFVRTWENSPAARAVVVYARPTSNTAATSFLPTGGRGDWQATLASALPDATDASSATSTLTTTDKFARSFFTQYAEFKKGSAGAPATTQDLANALVDQLDQQKQPTATYTRSDLHLTDNTTLAALAAYRKNLNDIIGKYSYKELGTELDAVEATLKNKTVAAGDEAALDRAHSAYEHIAHDLLAMPTPKPLAELQLMFVNNFAAMAASSASFKLAVDDPLAATLALETYHESSQAILAGFALQI